MQAKSVRRRRHVRGRGGPGRPRRAKLHGDEVSSVSPSTGVLVSTWSCDPSLSHKRVRRLMFVRRKKCPNGLSS